MENLVMLTCKEAVETAGGAAEDPEPIKVGLVGPERGDLTIGKDNGLRRTETYTACVRSS